MYIFVADLGPGIPASDPNQLREFKGVVGNYFSPKKISVRGAAMGKPRTHLLL
jgi:hypothetical protein